MTRIPTLDEVMSSEIKRDIAERYFGFRKLIEEDELDLVARIKQHSFILEKRISFDLIRIYVLLREENLIKAFLDLAGLHEQYFYDPYLIESAEISRRVLACQRFHGLFRSWRFRNFIFDCYDNLTYHADLYSRKIKELELEQGVIVKEIKRFYETNDLSAILHFLHSLADPQVSSAMQGGMETGLAEGLDKKMRISPPPPIEQVLTILPPLKPLAAIKPALKRLAQKAYAIQPPEILSYFKQGYTPCGRADQA